MTKKHAAEALADQLTEDHAWAAEELKTYIGSMVGAAEMLRTIPALEAERDALRAEVESLRADAERLDYIASNARCDPTIDGNHVWWPTTFNHRLTGPNLRAAIDAARKS